MLPVCYLIKIQAGSHVFNDTDIYRLFDDNLLAVLYTPGEVRGIDGRYEGVEIIVDGILDGLVECLHLQRG